MIGSISFGEIIPVEKGIIFSSRDGEGLYFLKAGEREAKRLAFFPDRRMKEQVFYKSLVKMGDRIFLSPSLADDIAVYDGGTKEIQTIPLDRMFGKAEGLCKFWTSLAVGNFVYLIGHYYPAIVKLNIHTLELTYLTGWVEQIERKRKLQDAPYLGIGIREGDTAFFPCCCTNGILKLDLRTDKTELCEVKTRINGFNGICFSEDRYWLPSRDSYDVAVWDIHQDRADTLAVLDSKRNKGNFYPPLLLGKKLYLFSNIVGHVYSMDTVDRTIRWIKGLDKILNNTPQLSSGQMKLVIPPALIQGKLCFVTARDCVWHVYDSDTESLTDFSVLPDEQGQKDLFRKRSWEWFYGELCEKGRSVLFAEEKLFGCKDFCDFVCEHQEELEILRSQGCRLEVDAGKHIYERARTEIHH